MEENLKKEILDAINLTLFETDGKGKLTSDTLVKLVNSKKVLEKELNSISLFSIFYKTN